MVVGEKGEGVQVEGGAGVRGEAPVWSRGEAPAEGGGEWHETNLKCFINKLCHEMKHDLWR